MATSERGIYICKVEGCHTAKPLYENLVLHYKSVHQGVDCPPIEECKVATLPEGYKFTSGGKVVSPPPAGAHPTPPQTDHPKPEKYEPAPPAAEQSRESVYRQAPEPSNILKKILTEYPGLKDAVVNEIMSWVSYKGNLHPMEVGNLLKAMEGVPKGAAEIIPQKYSLALQQAAAAGQPEVAMAIQSWGGQGFPQTPGSLGMPMMPSGGAPGQMPGNPMFNNYPFNPFPMGGFGWPGYPNQPQPQPGPQPPAAAANPEQDKRMEAIEANQQALTDTLKDVIGKLTETEEQKKEAALNARFEKIETMLIDFVQNIGTKANSDEDQNPLMTKMMEELQKTQEQLGKMQEDAANNRMATLEQTISTLSTELKNRDASHLKTLEAELHEYKEQAKKPVTGRTEMDVISDLAEKAIGAVQDAGKDIRSIFMSGQTKERFDPTRGDVKHREKVGGKIAVALENEAELAASEDSYLQQ